MTTKQKLLFSCWIIRITAVSSPIRPAVCSTDKTKEDGTNSFVILDTSFISLRFKKWFHRRKELTSHLHKKTPQRQGVTIHGKNDAEYRGLGSVKTLNRILHEANTIPNVRDSQCIRTTSIKSVNDKSAKNSLLYAATVSFSDTIDQGEVPLVRKLKKFCGSNERKNSSIANLKIDLLNKDDLFIILDLYNTDWKKKSPLCYNYIIQKDPEYRMSGYQIWCKGIWRKDGEENELLCKICTIKNQSKVIKKLYEKWNDGNIGYEIHFGSWQNKEIESLRC